MKTCISCGLPAVDPEEPPRYDVFNPEFDPADDDPSAVGPYCPECWPSTPTGGETNVEQ